jgi:ADP-heptose:LPS heptosyltransferase
MYSDNHFASLKRIAILRALGGLGDFLCIVPALRSLRAALPDAEIVLVGLPTAKEWVNRFSYYLDRLLEFPGYPGLPEQHPQLQNIPAFLAEAQAQRFDLALQMHGSGQITNPLMVLFGAKRNAGFFLPDCYCPDSASFLPYSIRESEVRRYLRLLNSLKIPTQSETLEFPVSAQDEQALRAVQETLQLHLDRYVCIHSGASVANRRWPIERFAEVADAIAQRGFQVVLTGSVEELTLTQAMAKAMRTDPINLAGCTSLGAMAALLKGAQFLVCNDTGVSHLADALQIPSVVIFTNADMARWAPLNRELHPAIGSEATPADVMKRVNTLLPRPTASLS